MLPPLLEGIRSKDLNMRQQALGALGMMIRPLLPDMKAGRLEAVLEPLGTALAIMLSQRGLPLVSVEGAVPILVPLVYACRRAAAAATAAGAEAAAEHWRTYRKSPRQVQEGMELLLVLLRTRAQFPSKPLGDVMMTGPDMAGLMALYINSPPSYHPLSFESQVAARSQEFFQRGAQVMKDLSAAPSACAACGATSKPNGQALAVCSVCKSAGYCSTKCQKADWRVHKKRCQAVGREGSGPVIVSQAQGQASTSRG